MPLATEQKRAVAQKVQIHSKDVGSPEVQIAVLGERIAQLTQHFKAFPKDHDSRHGLLAMVSRRKRLLTYLMPARYFVACLQTLFLAGDVGSVLVPCTLAMALIAAVLFTLLARLTRMRLE